MKINYFSAAHIIYIAIAILFVAVLYLVFRKRSFKAQRAVQLFLILVNVFQHLFKLEIYPMYDGGFSALCTAYNMCALLILLSPFAFFIKFAPLRDFVYYVGVAAGMVAILIPYWDIGEDAFTWSFFRFFFCHAVLFASSLLPLLFGHHKPKWRRFPLVGLSFFAGILLIILNDIIAIALGIYGTLSIENLYESLAVANPIWSFGVPQGAGFDFVVKIVDFFTPDFLLGENRWGIFIPVLWYFIPLYLGISLIAFTVFTISDKKGFKAFTNRIFAKKNRN